MSKGSRLTRWGILIMCGLVVAGCSADRQAEEEQAADQSIREQIKAAGEELESWDYFSVAIDNHLHSQFPNRNQEDLFDLQLTSRIEGTVANREPEFLLQGNLQVENRSEESYPLKGTEPEEAQAEYFSGFYSINDYAHYGKDLAPGDVYEQDFQVHGLETSRIEEAIWAGYDGATYIVFHDLADGRLRYYPDKDGRRHYTQRVKTSLERLASKAENLKIREEEEVIEIIGSVEEGLAEIMKIFWLDVHDLPADRIYLPSTFRLELDAETGIPLQFTVEDDPEADKESTTIADAQHSITFREQNENTIEAAVPSYDETHIIPHGFPDPETVYKNESGLALLPEMTEAAWNSRQIQVDDTILTLPFALQELLDLGFSLPNPSRQLDAAKADNITLLRDGIEVQVSIMNPGENTVPYSESTVQSISLFTENFENDDVPIYFPGGITIGSYLDEVIAQLPEPDHKKLNGGDTFEDARELLYIWEEEEGDHSTPVLEYSLHPQSKQVYYIHYR